MNELVFNKATGQFVTKVCPEEFGVWYTELYGGLTPAASTIETKLDVVERGFSLSYKATGRPVLCKICHRSDHWQPDGNGVFVCEHPDETGLLPIRQLDSVKGSEIFIVGLPPAEVL